MVVGGLFIQDPEADNTTSTATAIKHMSQREAPLILGNRFILKIIK
jgi:hypothetical protein